MNITSPACPAKSAAFSDVTAALFQIYAQHSPDVIWLADLQTGTLLYINTRFEQWWGVSIGELLNEPDHWLRAVVPSDAQALPSPFFMETPSALKSGALAPREYQITSRDGQSRWVRDCRFFLHDANGEPALLGGIAKDITEQHALAQARALVASMEDTVSRTLHDLRSPLNAISGWTTVLQRVGTPDGTQAKALDAIERNVHHLANMLNELQSKHRPTVNRQPAPLDALSAVAAVSQA